MNATMTCECDHLPDVFNLETHPHCLMNHLELVDNTEWLTFQRCVDCGQTWQLDNIDRLQVNLAIKFDSNVDWRVFDDKPLRFKYLIDARGGLSGDTCVMEGCENLALKSLAYCPAHAFDYVGMRE